jgi:hypothetical protein
MVDEDRAIVIRTMNGREVRMNPRMSIRQIISRLHERSFPVLSPPELEAPKPKLKPSQQLMIKFVNQLNLPQTQHSSRIGIPKPKPYRDYQESSDRPKRPRKKSSNRQMLNTHSNTTLPASTFPQPLLEVTKGHR